MNVWLTGAQEQACGLTEEEQHSSFLLRLHLPLMKCFIFPTGKMNGPGVVVVVWVADRRVRCNELWVDPLNP